MAIWRPSLEGKRDVVSFDGGISWVCNFQNYLLDKAKVKLIKTDASDDSPVQGAVFGVYKAADDTKVTELTTDANGEVMSEALYLGDYYIQEITAPNGYQLSTKKKYFSLVTKDETVRIYFDNNKNTDPPKFGKVTLTKVASETSAPLSNAIFGIYDARDDAKIGELISGPDGKSTSGNLSLGDYYLREISAPMGYELSSAKHPFTLTTNGQTVNVTANNTKLPDGPKTAKVKLLKLDSSDSSVKLKGAMFGVYKASDDSKVAELTTDDKGVAISENLPLDIYYLREIAAPDGYMLSSDKHLVQLNKADETLEITVKNEKKTSDTGKLKIIKMDAAGKSLQGAVFTLYDSSGKQLAEFVTSSDGTVTSGDLPVGDYYILEKTPPAGYKPITDKITFTIQADKTYEAKVVNQPLKLPKGTVEVFFKHIKHKHELAKAQSYTDDVGKEYLPWIQKNGYDGMPIKGYHFVKTDYPTSKVLIDGKLTVVVWYDDGEDVPGGAADGQGGSGSGSGSGTKKLPKTGEPFPWANYLLGALCLCLAGMMGFVLTRTRKTAN